MTSREKHYVQRQLKVVSLLQQGEVNFSKIARQIRISPKMVKQISSGLSRDSTVSECLTVPCKNKKLFSKIDAIIEDPTDPFLSVYKTKRKLEAEGFKAGRELILRRFHQKGLIYQYLKSPKVTNKKKEMSISDQKQMYELINFLAGCFKENKSVLFVDEFKAPIQQKPIKTWANRNFRSRLERVGVKKTYTVAVGCLKSSLVGLQIFKRELRRQDYEYFILSILSYMKRTDQKVDYIVNDNARWHLKERLIDKYFTKTIIYTVPYRFETNLIELCFSQARYLYRIRRVSPTEEQEIKEIVSIFRRINHPRNFEGFQVRFFFHLIDMLERVKEQVEESEEPKFGDWD